MTVSIKKEGFVGKYLPFEPPINLPEGSLVEGKNLLRKSIYGGWTPRKGYTLVNTTPDDPIESIHQYKNPFYEDWHCFVQISSALFSLSRVGEELILDDDEPLLLSSDEKLFVSQAGEPLTQKANFGSSLISVGTEPGFSCVVGEDWIYCDGENRPIIFGGDTPRCDGFIVYDGNSGVYIDYTSEVTDLDPDTYAIISAHADTVYYVGMKERGTEIHLILETGNTNNITATVKAFRSGSWTDTSASDGTVGTYTHDTDGALTWSGSSNDSMTQIANKQLYWYEVSFSGAPTATTVKSCKTVREISLMTNKWDSEFHYVDGAVYFDGTTYTDCHGKVTDDSQSTYMDVSSMGTSGYIYFKTTEPLLGIGFKMVGGSVNTANAQFDLLESMTSVGWATVGAFTDGTLDTVADTSLNQDGTVWVTNEHEAQQMVLISGDSPGYWYRISADAALSATTYIAEMVYAAWPKALHPFSGCVEYDGKLVLWGEKHYGNRLLVSPYNRPDQFAFHSDRYTIPFGGSDPVLNCIPIGDYLMVFKRKGIYLTDRNYSSLTTLSTETGLASPHTAVLISSGDRTVKEDETKNIIMWQDRDGVYKATEDLQITKVSSQIRNYFLPDKSEYIGDDYITSLSAYYHSPTDTYRLVLPEQTLAYSIGTSEWLPLWEYELTPLCGLYCLGPDDQATTLIGTSEGLLVEAEKVTSDRDESNTQVAIEHYGITRPIYLTGDNLVAGEGAIRKIWTECKADSGTWNLWKYINWATTPTVVETPAEPSLSNSGYNIVVQRFDLGDEAAKCFQLKFHSNTIDQILEFYSFNYQVDLLRVPS